MADISTDPRLDPRIKEIMGAMPPPSVEDVGSREELLAMFNDSELLTRREQMEAMFDMIDNEQVAPSRRAGCFHPRIYFSPGWQYHQGTVHSPPERGAPALRVLHTRRR